ncbi:hypothetical protein Trydic_g20294, partial [Trypoxylus dichotomus]
CSTNTAKPTTGVRGVPPQVEANPQKSSVTVFTRRTVPPLRIPRPPRFFNSPLKIRQDTSECS